MHDGPLEKPFEQQKAQLGTAATRGKKTGANLVAVEHKIKQNYQKDYQ